MTLVLPMRERHGGIVAVEGVAGRRWDVEHLISQHFVVMTTRNNHSSYSSLATARLALTPPRDLTRPSFLSGSTTKVNRACGTLEFTDFLFLLLRGFRIHFNTYSLE